jgi:hypothetical protein
MTNDKPENEKIKARRIAETDWLIGLLIGETEAEQFLEWRDARRARRLSEATRVDPEQIRRRIDVVRQFRAATGTHASRH